MARCLIRRFPTLRTHPESRFYWTCKATILSCLAGVADVPSRAAVQCNVGASGAMSSSVEANAPRDSVENTSSKDSIPKVIVLTGATGVGKTELSLILADRLNGEIISADSVQVYKHLDVGSDKLPLGQRKGIPHHLIDILDPLDPGAEYSAGDFHDAAHATVADVLSRGATPIVIGGTGFYLRTFMCGKPHGGKAPPGVERRVRTLITAALYEALADSPAELAAADGAAGTLAPPGRIASGEAPAAEDGGDPEAGPHSPRGAPVDAATLATGMVEAAVRAARHGAGGAAADALEERLWLAGVELLRRAGDADGATRVAHERNNWYRLQRAMEIVLATGKPTAASAAGAAPSTDKYDFRAFFLHRPRLEVFERIDERVEHMVLGGLLDEAHMLREAGAQPGDTPATRAIGYRQALAWLNGVAAARICDAAAVRQLAASIQGPTRRLQRAQLVFHRGDDAFAWIDATPGPAAAAEDILTRLSQATHTGGSESFGLLSEAEKDAAKRYITQWKYLNQEEHVESIRAWLARKGYID